MQFHLVDAQAAVCFKPLQEIRVYAGVAVLGSSGLNWFFGFTTKVIKRRKEGPPLRLVSSSSLHLDHSPEQFQDFAQLFSTAAFLIYVAVVFLVGDPLVDVHQPHVRSFPTKTHGHLFVCLVDLRWQVAQSVPAEPRHGRDATSSAARPAAFVPREQWRSAHEDRKVLAAIEFRT